MIAEPETTERVRIWTEPPPRCPKCRRPLTFVDRPRSAEEGSDCFLACVGIAAGDGGSCGWSSRRRFLRYLKPRYIADVIEDLIAVEKLKQW